jgi:hypothetical protein
MVFFDALADCADASLLDVLKVRRAHVRIVHRAQHGQLHLRRVVRPWP